MGIIKLEHIQKNIFEIRGKQVMLDRDLAQLYKVKPFRLREQVKRNLNRFPSSFMFRLINTEVDFNGIAKCDTI